MECTLRVGRSNYERINWELDSLDNRVNQDSLLRNGKPLVDGQDTELVLICFTI